MIAKPPIAAAAVAAALRRALIAVRPKAAFPHGDPHLGSAWSAWRAADFVGAERAAERLATDAPANDAGHFMLALTRHVRGDHRAAIEHFERVDPSYRWRDVAVEPMLWSYVFAGETDRAIAHAKQHRLGQVAIDRIRLSANRPLRVATEGVVDLPFTADGLSAYMPGMAATINGERAVVRLDTGGSYLHLSEEAAARLGIETVAGERAFASLARTRVAYGVADLELGPVALENVPVAVHAEGLSAAPLAAQFGAPMDAIVGTNVLERFLATVDGPNARMILSRRGDAAAARAHDRLLTGDGVEVPFGMWTDHLMIVRGELAGRGPVALFVDSGLVVVTRDQGQASLLASQRNLAALGLPSTGNPTFAPVPGRSGLAGALRGALTAYPVPDRTWAGFGGWGGVDVAALIGWGYLQHFAWTLDFDRRVYVLRPNEPAA